MNSQVKLSNKEIKSDTKALAWFQTLDILVNTIPVATLEAKNIF